MISIIGITVLSKYLDLCGRKSVVGELKTTAESDISLRKFGFSCQKRTKDEQKKCSAISRQLRLTMRIMSCGDDIEIHVLTDAQFLFAVLCLRIRKVRTGGKHAIMLRVHNVDDKHAKQHDDEDDNDELLFSAK